MVKTVFGKVMWVGRATIFMVGLAVILALVFGVATTALGATGGNFILGKANVAGAVSKLTAGISGPALQLVDGGGGDGAGPAGGFFHHRAGGQDGRPHEGGLASQGCQPQRGQARWQGLHSVLAGRDLQSLRHIRGDPTRIRPRRAGFL